MTLSLQAVDDPATDQNHRQIAQQFPIQAANLANGAVGTKALAKASVTDEKLAKPTIVGSVSAAGVKENGEGFTCEKTGVGTYKITLTTELATNGILVATPFGEFNRVPAAGVPAKKVFTLATTISTTGVAADTAFNFMIKAS